MWIAYCYCKTCWIWIIACFYYECTNCHHCSVSNFLILWFLKFTIFVYLCISHKHVFSGNSNIIKHQISIWIIIISVFWTYITCLYTRMTFISLWIPQRHNECLNSMPFSTTYKLSLCYTMCSRNTKITYPPFTCSYWWWVYYEFFMFHIINSLSL